MPETDYWVRLRAVNELGFSSWSNAIVATTTAEEEEETTEDSLIEGDNKPEPSGETVDEARTDSMFFGIFFAGGILVISFACMVIIRLV